MTNATKKAKQTAASGKQKLNDLIRACAKGDRSFVKGMLRQGIDPNILNEGSGSRPLTAAVRGGHTEIVKLLLDSGADPNLRDTWKSMPPNGTALENAAGNGHLDIAKLLVERGADINMEGYWRPLKTAAASNRPEIVQFLINSGAKVEPNDLVQATFAGSDGVVKLLIATGTDVDHQNKKGHSALYFAAGSKNPHLAEMLIAAGANVNIQTSDFWETMETPLHKAAAVGRTEIVQMLLAAGANAALTDKFDKTPEQHAKRMGHKEIAKILRDWQSAKRSSSVRLRRHRAGPTAPTN